MHEPARARLAASSPEWWQEVKRQASMHGLSAVLAHRCGAYLPASESVWMSGVVATHLASHNSRLRELKTTLAALDAEGIRAVALKGPVLGERFHNPAYAKVSGDLDILVDEIDIPRASGCMAALGLREEEHELPWFVRRRRYHHILLLPADPQPDRQPDFASVELHYRLPSQHTPIGASDLLDRSEPWSGANGLEARVLDPADEAIYLAIHAARHFFARLAWLYDTLMVFRSLSPTHRCEVMERAGNAGKIKALSVANRAAVEFFGETLLADLPDFPAWPRFQREAFQTQQFQLSMAWRERCYQHMLKRKLGLEMIGSPRDFFDYAEENFLMPAVGKACSLLYKIRA
jgi:hypothetical protein